MVKNRSNDPSRGIVREDGRRVNKRQDFEGQNPTWQSNSKVGTRRRIQLGRATYTWKYKDSTGGLSREDLVKEHVKGYRGAFNRNVNFTNPQAQTQNMYYTEKNRNKSKVAQQGALQRNDWVRYIKLAQQYWFLVFNIRKGYPAIIADPIIQLMYHASPEPVPPEIYPFVRWTDIETQAELDNQPINWQIAFMRRELDGQPDVIVWNPFDIIQGVTSALRQKIEADAIQFYVTNNINPSDYKLERALYKIQETREDFWIIEERIFEKMLEERIKQMHKNGEDPITDEDIARMREEYFQSLSQSRKTQLAARKIPTKSKISKTTSSTSATSSSSSTVEQKPKIEQSSTTNVARTGGNVQMPVDQVSLFDRQFKEARNTRDVPPVPFEVLQSIIQLLTPEQKRRIQNNNKKTLHDNVVRFILVPQDYWPDSVFLGIKRSAPYYYPEDMYRLFPGDDSQTWLNNWIIDVICVYIYSRNYRKTMGILSPIQYGLLENKTKKRGSQAKFKTYSEEFMTAIMSEGVLIIPDLGNNHWITLHVTAVQRNDEEVVLNTVAYDSLQNLNSQMDKIIEFMVNFLRIAEYFSEGVINTYNPSIKDGQKDLKANAWKKQSDGGSCGIFALRFLQELYGGRKPTKQNLLLDSEDDINETRLSFANLVCQVSDLAPPAIQTDEAVEIITAPPVASGGVYKPKGGVEIKTEPLKKKRKVKEEVKEEKKVKETKKEKVAAPPARRSLRVSSRKQQAIEEEVEEEVEEEIPVKQKTKKRRK